MTFDDDFVLIDDVEVFVMDRDTVGKVIKNLAAIKGTRQGRLGIGVVMRVRHANLLGTATGGTGNEACRTDL
jgi:hypothetical protein